ncbi:MAG: hypothetical protein WBS22_10545 [Methylocystis sp.]
MSDGANYDFELPDDLLKEIQSAYDAHLLKIKHPYVFDLIKTLMNYPNGLKRKFVIDFMLKKRKDLGLPIPRSFENTVQAQMNFYCKDSEVFKERRASEDEALFCWPKGPGAGAWALIRPSAKRWVEQHRAMIPTRIVGA